MAWPMMKWWRSTRWRDATHEGWGERYAQDCQREYVKVQSGRLPVSIGILNVKVSAMPTVVIVFKIYRHITCGQHAVLVKQGVKETLAILNISVFRDHEKLYSNHVCHLSILTCWAQLGCKTHMNRSISFNVLYQVISWKFQVIVGPSGSTNSGKRQTAYSSRDWNSGPGGLSSRVIWFTMFDFVICIGRPTRYCSSKANCVNVKLCASPAGQAQPAFASSANVPGLPKLCLLMVPLKAQFQTLSKWWLHTSPICFRCSFAHMPLSHAVPAHQAHADWLQLQCFSWPLCIITFITSIVPHQFKTHMAHQPISKIKIVHVAFPLFCGVSTGSLPFHTCYFFSSFTPAFDFDEGLIWSTASSSS